LRGKRNQYPGSSVVLDDLCDTSNGKHLTAWQLDPGGVTGPQEKALAKKRRSKKVTRHSNLHYEE
jgi:hypothetical protein